jgi:hypothetical protein
VVEDGAPCAGAEWFAAAIVVESTDASGDEMFYSQEFFHSHLTL